jgi:hypothetical protein
MARNKTAKTTTATHTGDYTGFDAKWDRMEEGALRAHVAVNTPEIAETAKYRAVRDAAWGEFMDAADAVAAVIGWDSFALRMEIVNPDVTETVLYSEPMVMTETGEIVIISDAEATAVIELDASRRDENGWLPEKCAAFGADVAACRARHRAPALQLSGAWRDSVALAA